MKLEMNVLEMLHLHGSLYQLVETFIIWIKCPALS